MIMNGDFLLIDSNSEQKMAFTVSGAQVMLILYLEEMLTYFFNTFFNVK